MLGVLDFQGRIMSSSMCVKRIYQIAVVAFVAVLAGCAVVPEPIKVADENSLISYRQANENPASVEGKPARWGGVIAKVENLPEATMLEVLHYPLRSYGRPVSGDESMGRFRVYVNGFLDPMVFEQGRSVTFTGDLIGVEEGKVGEHRYVFPTIQSKGYHLWKEIERVEISSIHMWPYYDPWGWRYGPYHQRVIIRRSGHRYHGSDSSGNRNSGIRSSSGTRSSSATNGSSSSSSRAGSPSVSPRQRSGNTTGTVKDY